MPSKRRLRWAALPVGIATAAVLAGCSPTQLHGYLPGFQEDGVPTTNRVDMVAGLWVNSWIVLLVVGLVTWGLMLWAAVAYRRRKGQTGLPVQLRYNMPIEIFYTVVPLILVVGFFAFTARDQDILETQYEDPEVSITAYGKQWAWDFQYNGEDEDFSDAVWSMGVQAEPEGDGYVDQDALPTLYLPVDKTVRIELQSRDVAHSFWVIDFLYKKDMYLGRDNFWSFTPTREGTYAGKCAELCGEYHSAMLFNVKVVSEAEYEDYLDTLRDAGQTGDIDEAYDRLQGNTGFGRAEEG
ncbi:MULTISPECIES: cytochrome c oxidase subunit II [Microbacterium]|uniref:cytochrome-c oxidase n=1 Tax=Microbacterium wangchenii TaxID=2541726 RepID=A0ABX5SQQ5_9MICO|nr:MULTISPECIES: cytochrome c oxidase subunit II [Microbacterium]MCK6065005.1 cytochrome c oxidase subunit II [Microbacterium sp. EYE_512]QBR88478.1 cytochrome c oxidase subunit II [Microbacterium wangchenii]TFV82469.1 cytochrome c oxidase subunit II [Microbacterium sp. dk485]TXK20205.1 cytochrome c oxidase subunit II [Microbacterium wangchenii]